MKTHLFLGPEKLAARLKQFGFSGEIPTDLPSLALGTKEVSPKELCEGYNVLANLGTAVTPKLITKITTFDGELIYEAKQKNTKLAEKSDVYILNEAMTSIFDNNMTYNIRPTGVSIKALLNHTYSAKSGSTKTDNWMAGYNPDLCCVVWTGYDDSKEIVKSADLKSAKFIWADTVEAYYINKEANSWYTKPDDVIKVDLNPISGFYPSFEEYYKPVFLKLDNLPWYVRLLYNEKNPFII